MNFPRPLRAELTGTDDIWIIDAADAFVTRFPRVSDDIAADLKRAAADTGKEFHEKSSMLLRSGDPLRAEGNWRPQRALLTATEIAPVHPSRCFRIIKDGRGGNAKSLFPVRRGTVCF